MTEPIRALNPQYHPSRFRNADSVPRKVRYAGELPATQPREVPAPKEKAPCALRMIPQYAKDSA